MTTDITELAQRARINAECGEHLSPAETIELVEALEKAQAENTAGVAGMAESYETTISMLRSRIAELESRTVTVKLPSLPYLGAKTIWYQGFAAGAEGMRNDCAHAITAAGIKVEAE